MKKLFAIILCFCMLTQFFWDMFIDFWQRCARGELSFEKVPPWTPFKELAEKKGGLPCAAIALKGYCWGQKSRTLAYRDFMGIIDFWWESHSRMSRDSWANTFPTFSVSPSSEANFLWDKAKRLERKATSAARKGSRGGSCCHPRANVTFMPRARRYAATLIHHSVVPLPSREGLDISLASAITITLLLG